MIFLEVPDWYRNIMLYGFVPILLLLVIIFVIIAILIILGKL